MAAQAGRARRAAGFTGWYLMGAAAAIVSGGAVAAPILLAAEVRMPSTGASACPVLDIRLDGGLRPAGGGTLTGTELTIPLQAEPDSDLGQAIESEQIPGARGYGVAITGIALEATGDLPQLVIRLEDGVRSRVLPSAAGRLRLEMAPEGAPPDCRARPIPAAFDAGDPAIETAPAIAQSDLTDRDLEKLEESRTLARAAIVSEDYDTAIRQLTRILSFPENPYSAEAQELLGVVREKNGQFAHAKAEYQLYLEKYPDSAGALRVQQRLTALETAEAAPPEDLRTLETVPRVVGTDQLGAGGPTFESARKARPGTAGPRRSAPPEETFPKDEFFGSVDLTYYFNQGTTRLTEFDTSRTTVDDFIYDNSLVTSLDFERSRELPNAKLSTRIVGALDTDFSDGGRTEIQLSRLYGSLRHKSTGVTYTIGRQSMTDNGVYGRFDGGRITWDVAEHLRLNAQVGTPVDSVLDGLFGSDRVMMGGSVTIVDAIPDGDIAFYAINQQDGSLTDRQAVGFEAQYLGGETTLTAALDYDVYFDKVNFARLSANHLFADGSSITASVDQVQSPYLSLTNALQGQTAESLDELLLTYSLDEVRQLALDRTTESRSLTLAYSRPLNDIWQLSLDGTIFVTDGNPASGGVPEVPAPGEEFYSSVNLYGSGVFTENDTVAATLRYADTASSQLYLVDTYYRYRRGRKLRARPRLKIGYRDLSAGGHEVFLTPSATLDWELKEDVTLNLEVGDNWSRTDRQDTQETSNDYYAFVGLRRDF